MRCAEHDFTVSQWPHDFQRTSSLGKLEQALPEGVTYNDAAVLSPIGAGEVVDFSHRDHSSAFDGNLVDLTAVREADPQPVGREERPAHSSLRAGKFGR